MATQIIQRVICDLCAVDDEQIDADRSIAITLDGTAYAIDVCKEHGEPFDGIANLLDEHARRLPKSGRKVKESGNGGPAPSLMCPTCNGGPYVNRQGLATHLRTKHDMSYAEAMGEPITAHCDVCGKGFTAAAGLSVHRAKAHPDAEPIPETAA